MVFYLFMYIIAFYNTFVKYHKPLYLLYFLGILASPLLLKTYQDTMKKFLRTIPIEGYVVVLPSLLFLSAIGYFAVSCHRIVYDYCSLNTMSGHFMSVLKEDSVLLQIILIPLLVYTLAVIVYSIYQYRMFKKEAADYIRSFLGIFLLLGLISFVIGAGAQILFNTANGISVIRASDLLMHFDKIIFGVYPPIYLAGVIQNGAIANAIYQIYLATFALFAVTMTLTLLTRKYFFRKIVLSFWIAFLFSVPLWLLVPAISPDLRYGKNTLNAPVQEEIRQAYDQVLIPTRAQEALHSIQDMWIDPKGMSIPISTFPSFHAIWGVITTVILFDLWLPLGLAAIPWLLIELTSTVYTFEHYAVDVICGILVASAALYLAKKLLAYDTKYCTDRWRLFALVEKFETNFGIFIKKIEGIGQKK